MWKRHLSAAAAVCTLLRRPMVLDCDGSPWNDRRLDKRRTNPDGRLRGDEVAADWGDDVTLWQSITRQWFSRTNTALHRTALHHKLSTQISRSAGYVSTNNSILVTMVIKLRPWSLHPIAIVIGLLLDFSARSILQTLLPVFTGYEHPSASSSSWRLSSTELLMAPHLSTYRISCSTSRCVADRSFATAGPRLWNSLPADVRSASSVTTFRQKLKTHLFRQSYPDVVL